MHLRCERNTFLEFGGNCLLTRENLTKNVEYRTLTGAATVSMLLQVTYCHCRQSESLNAYTTHAS